MKRFSLIYIMTALMSISLTGMFSSCATDDLGPSIFVDPVPYLDRSSNSFALDTFCKAEFLEPYNLNFMYRLEDVGADMQKNLVPTSYENSKKFAVLCKYLWYDVYKEIAGEEFLKQYSPRIIHLIGSASYNPTSGTKTIGLAEGGIKISLFQGNMIDEGNIDFMNEQFFKTMHHEFSHILHQTKVYPTSFKLLSKGLYNPMDWNNTPDSIAAARGFASPYGSSGENEDWVEIIANYIVKDTIQWTSLVESAGYDWEYVENVGADTIDRAISAGISPDVIGYIHGVATYNSDGGVNQYNIQRKVIERDSEGNIILTDGTIVEIGNGAGTPFAGGWTTRVKATGEPVDVTGKLKFANNADGVDGKAIILEKLDMVRTWTREKFGFNLDLIRKRVQERQWLTDDEGNFVMRNGKFVNALLEPSKEDPSRTQMEVILDWVNRFDAIREQ